MTAEREWVTFADPKERGRRWQLDVTWLTSHWRCLFGDGCQGVLTAPTPERVLGCCSYGAWFTDEADMRRTERFARKLTDADWQFAAVGREKGVAAKVGNSYRTRLVGDACIFLNRVGFAAGPGCALHSYALRIGREPMEFKPEVCWQLPLRRIDRDEDDGTVTSILSEFGRDGWGEGGADFAWWCTEDPEAFTAGEPVYKTLGPELRGIMGSVLYDEVASYLDERRASSMPPVPHPSEVPVTISKRPERRRAARGR